MPQTSTEDALYDAMTIIRDKISEKKIIAVVSLDIEGAFDNAWWPAIIKQLYQMKCDPLILSVIHSYLSEREVEVQYAGTSVRRSTNKGCIQGSTCGPLMWNLLLDPLLKAAEGLEAHIQAFADDILLIADADDIPTLERIANRALEVVADWGVRSKLKFATHKTKTVIITKRLKYDEPRIVFQTTTLELNDNLTVLGVTIDKSLNFIAHLDKVTAKAINVYKGVSRAARATWGLNSSIVGTIYSAVIEPIVLYGAKV